jgi:hypothetical protein
MQDIRITNHQTRPSALRNKRRSEACKQKLLVSATAAFQNTGIRVEIVRKMEVSEVPKTFKLQPTTGSELWKTNAEMNRLPEDRNGRTRHCA